MGCCSSKDGEKFDEMLALTDAQSTVSSSVSFTTTTESEPSAAPSAAVCEQKQPAADTKTAGIYESAGEAHVVISGWLWHKIVPLTPLCKLKWVVLTDQALRFEKRVIPVTEISEIDKVTTVLGMTIHVRHCGRKQRIHFRMNTQEELEVWVQALTQRAAISGLSQTQTSLPDADADEADTALSDQKLRV
mmetsp:Transcript_65496/g.108831  ORF Transcript_65496/g.108831 Transcript_65496/m.108831 type:complete len:190 (+) Transcript_65496:43-612(+)|eukprot:CAMPEP_0119324100 /NCGR_PEP_ID=MMETSP1333-20130426/62345_1 /TAXON_ID=418940 /ORGANISM="Scyphosphaera apsteinii, Strain RCC1455" /LENGTH=189 /DNA_ID=CAMNT_0007331717 /DNA_START=43 /DNA_END=612 /DNA_ORIENTATION=-